MKWHKLDDINLQSEVEENLKLIANKLKDVYQNKNIGLLSGNSGIALFLFYYAKHIQSNKYYQIAMDVVDDIFNKVESSKVYNTYCNGIIGFAWFLEHICTNNFVEYDNTSFIEEIDSFIAKTTIDELHNENLDFIHGSVGGLLYLTKRYSNNPKPDLLKAILKYVNILNKTKVLPIDEQEGRKNINLGMAHGIPAILIILCKIYNLGLNKEETKKLIHYYVEYIISNEMIKSDYKCIFPSNINSTDGNMTPSRMAWCYGDLGIAYSLLSASKIIKDKKYLSLFDHIIDNSLKRINDIRNPYEYVKDAMFCHGTSGIAHMFLRMSFSTKKQDCYNISKYWLNETLKFSRTSSMNIQIDNYKSYNPELNSMKENDFSLLGGITGIGLSLLSFVSDEEPKWDECLMLS